MPARRRVVEATLLVLLATQVAPAFAQQAAPAAPAAPLPATPPDDAAVKAKFGAALKLHKAGKFDEALPLFREVVQTTQSPNARLYVALCLEQLGKHIEAYKEMTQTVKDASLHNEAKYDQTREAAQAELAVLGVRVGKLVITFPETPAGLAVSVDGSHVDERDIGASLVLEPGSHRVEATATGLNPVTREVHLDGGETRTVTLAFGKPEAPAPVATKAEPPPPPPAPKSTGAGTRVAGFTAAGVGVAGLAVFTVTGLMARSKYNSLKQACGNVRCTDPKYADTVNSGKSLQTVANVGLIVGAVGVALGTTLIVFGSRKDSPAASAALLPGGGYVSYETAF